MPVICDTIIRSQIRPPLRLQKQVIPKLVPDFDPGSNIPNPKLTVRVVLPLPLDKPYTYLVPEDMAGAARVGSRVLVPFGPRRLTGMVVATHAEAPPGTPLKALLDVLDDEPAFTDELLRLTRWMAGYYVCSWGEVVRAALPAGTDVASERLVACAQAEAAAWLDHPDGARLRAYLLAQGPTPVATLQQTLGVSQALLRRLARAGALAFETTLTAPRAQVKHEKHLRFAPAFRHAGAARELRAQLRGAKQRALVEALAGLALEGERLPRQADVLARAEATAASLKALLERGIVEVVEQEVMRSPLDEAPPAQEAPRPALHGAQQAALEAMSAVLAERRFETFLLHGITGSGKTEVYLAALEQTLAQGRTGIILVPEIALTPQTVRRFRARFGDRIAVLHSRMSLGERFDAWRALRSGRYRVVIGPRSAVLAPLSDIGLIVVDEEHEPSYKQFDPAPRYHARDVAVYRARLNGAVCLLGSATPSLESYHNARRGKYRLLSMPARVPVGASTATLPEVHLVDLTLEHKKHRLHGVLSEPLRDAIRARLERAEQVILLQNRRGYAPVVECAACGWTPACPDCSVTLTLHRKPPAGMRAAGPLLRCHYCGRIERLPGACPQCREADALLRHGAGTQRVEEELATCFPQARLLRMDLDTTGRKNAHQHILDRFGRGEADVLIGTQMVAKGLDFARVTLVGVVNADAGLLLPDFRAEERTFQLLTQVAGRAGRAHLPGEVLLQTRHRDHPAFRFTCSHDYEAFAEAVLQERRLFGYPPFGRLAAAEFRGPHEATVHALARAWTDALAQAAGAAVQVLGPEAAFIGRVKRQYRVHTLVKLSRRPHAPGLLQALLRQATDAAGPLPRGYRLALDVDPAAFL